MWRRIGSTGCRVESSVTWSGGSWSNGARCGRREEALRLAARTPTLPLYGAPDPRDGMYASLAGAPEYEALLTRSRDAVDAERKRLGLGALRREGKR